MPLLLAIRAVSSPDGSIFGSLRWWLWAWFVQPVRALRTQQSGGHWLQENTTCLRELQM